MTRLAISSHNVKTSWQGYGTLGRALSDVGEKTFQPVLQEQRILVSSPSLWRQNSIDDCRAAGRIRSAVSRTVVPRTPRAPRRDRPARRLGSGTLRRAAACPSSLPRRLLLPAATAGDGTIRRSAVSNRPRRPRTIRPLPSPPSPRRHTPRPRLSPPSPVLLALARIASGCKQLSTTYVPEHCLTFVVFG